ncbi:MAG TPA: NepR family anti-sigma factor [Pseudolabrys sp.]|nr:NepR family anti-sigma factor [Pseudolabrys sp.]
MAESGVFPVRGWGKMASDGKNGPGHNKHETLSDGKVVSLGRDVQVKIGQHLRTMYDEVVKQGVPDHLSELLQKLDKTEKTKTDDDKRQ